MPEPVGMSSRQQLVSLVAQALDTPEKQQAFVDASLFSVPRLHAQIKVGQAARVFAIQLVTACLAYGQAQGQPVVALLLDELENWLGEDHQLQITTIRGDLLPPPPQPTTTQVQTVQAIQTINDTDALIERFYTLYQQQHWPAALALLDELGRAADLPRLFDLMGYRHELQGRTREQARTLERDREYRLLRLMAKAESRERVWASLKTLWQVYPGYDPDGLADWVFEGDKRYIEAVRRVALAYHTHSASLHLSDLGLEVLPGSLGYLEGLRWLYCANNLLMTFPAQLGKLNNLEIIHAEHNHIRTFPTALARLPQLRALYLKYNAIDYLPPEIGQLDRLEILDLRHNRLRDLPPELGLLHALSVLVLDHNQLTALPRFLFGLHNLTWLLAADNDLETIPADIEALGGLRLLSLSYNRLRDLPPALGRLPQLETLFVTRGNPLDLLPREVVEAGNSRLLVWLRRRAGQA